MSKITVIDRPTCRVLRDKIQQAMNTVAAEHGIVITLGSGSFTHNNVKFKVECAVEKNGEVLSQTTEDFKRYAPLFQIDPDALGKEFQSNGKTFRITGWNARSHRYPIIAERCPDGRLFKFNVKTIQSKYEKVS